MGMKLWAKSAPGPDFQDLVHLLTAFEAINRVRLGIRMSRSLTSRVPDMAVTLVASEVDTESGDLKDLGSVSLTCLASNLRSLEAVLIHGLYLLDAQLARHELEVASKE